MGAELRLSPSGPPRLAGGDYSVLNLTALAAVPATKPSLYWVWSLLCYWKRNPTSTLVPDGITVIAAQGGGNWERMVETTGRDWLSEGFWFIDPVAGNDEAAGTAIGTPLRTLEEISRRLSAGPILQDIVIQYASGTVVSASLTLDSGGHNVRINGHTTTISTPIIATFAPDFSLVGIADLTPYIGGRFRETLGPGCWWLTSVDPNGGGVGTARITDLDRSGPPPAPGDGCVYESLDTIIGILDVDITDQRGSLLVENLTLSHGTLPGLESNANAVEWAIQNVGAVVLWRCLIQSGYVENSFFKAKSRNGPYIYGNGFRSGILYQTCGFLLGEQGWIPSMSHFAKCAFMGQSFPQVHTSEEVVFANCLWDGTYPGLSIGQFNGWYEETNVKLINNSFFHGYGIVLNPGAKVWSYGTLGGLVDAPSGVVITGDKVHFRYHDIPTITGAVSDIRIGFKTVPVDLVWATLNYFSDAQYGQGTLIAGTATMTARHADANGVIVSRNSIGGVPGAYLIAPVGSRAAGQFVVNAVDAAGLLVATDTSEFDWFIPPLSEDIIIALDESEQFVR